MKKDLINLVPILHLIIPIIIGMIIGFICKKLKTIYQTIISVVICMIYLWIVAFYTSSQNETQLLLILFIWNTSLMFISSKVSSYLFNRKKD